MDFVKNKNKEELAVVFDVGSATVGGAVFYIRESGSPHIVYSVSEQIKIENEFKPENLLGYTLDALKLVAGRICMKGLGNPSKIFCIISSPWYTSQTRKIKFNRNTPFVFDDKLADGLIQKEIQLFEEEQAKDNPELAKGLKILEVKTMKTVLNGYETNKPLGQKAKELEMTIFVSIGEDVILKKFSDSIKQHFPHHEIKFSTFVMSSFAVARDMFVNQNDFLLINIGGEVTDISMIKKEVLSDTVSFPIGRNYVIRGVASGLNSSLSEAISLITLYKEGHMETSVIKKFEVIIGELKKSWLINLQESLNNLSTQISIPATIFITLDQEFSTFFGEIIKTEQFSQYTLTESKFRVIFLSNQALHGIAEFEENIDRDPFVIIESIYINRFLK